MGRRAGGAESRRWRRRSVARAVGCPHVSKPSATPFGSWLLGPADQSRGQLRVRVQLLLTALLLATNVIGAGAVVGIFFLVRPAVPMSTSDIVTAFIAVPVYVVLAVVIGLIWGTAESLAALRWVEEQRAPSAAEARTALRVPMRLTRMQAILWAGSLATFTGLALWQQQGLALTVAMSVTIAGVLVSAISYLLSEFALRPVSARALADDSSLLEAPARGSGVRRRMLLFWALGTGVPVSGLLVTAVLALVSDELTETRLAVVVLVVGGTVWVVGMLIAALDARAVVSPLLAVRDGLARVERGEFDHRVQVYDGTELGALQAGFNRMAAGLGERERMRDLFGRHVGRDVAEAAMGGEVELGGEVRVVSVLFVDLVGSTTYAAERDPGEVVEVLNRFCAVVVDEVDRRHGLVNKFMGDAVLAIFGAPVDVGDHATAALQAARAIVRRLAAEVTEVTAGVGVATGEAVAGNVGDERRFEYTVIGDAVNEAARLTELAKDRQERVACSAATLRAAEAAEQERWRDDEPVVLRGRSDPTEVAVPRAPHDRADRDDRDDPDDQGQASATSSA